MILAIELSNLVALRRMERNDKRPATTPNVSILVPARNEEHNIIACVDSILDQNYTNFEVIVLDDCSTDKTLEKLKQYKNKDSKLFILEGEELPQGWTGKNWACHQLFTNANGDLLLFLDADTRLNANALNSAVNSLLRENADFISALPREETITCSEKLLVPVMNWGVFCFYPLVLAMKSRIPALAVSIGQFMLFTRQAYKKIGGHAAAKTEITEDKALPKAIVKQKMKWLLLDGTESLTTRMYLNFSDTYNGLSKSLFPWFDSNVPIYTFIWLWLLVVFWQPLIVLTMSLIDSSFTTSTSLAIVSVALSFITWSIFYIRFKYPPFLIVLYPVIIPLWVSVAMASMIRSLFGTTTWKDRPLSQP